MKKGQITCSCGETFKNEHFATAQAQFVIHQNLLFNKQDRLCHRLTNRSKEDNIDNTSTNVSANQ